VRVRSLCTNASSPVVARHSAYSPVADAGAGPEHGGLSLAQDRGLPSCRCGCWRRTLRCGSCGWTRRGRSWAWPSAWRQRCAVRHRRRARPGLSRRAVNVVSEGWQHGMQASGTTAAALFSDAGRCSRSLLHGCQPPALLGAPPPVAARTSVTFPTCRHNNSPSV